MPPVWRRWVRLASMWRRTSWRKPRARSCRSPLSRHPGWLFIAAALAGIEVTIYALLDDWKRGARIAAAPWMRVALRYGGIAPAVLLFLLTLRRSGAPASALAGSPSALKPWIRSMTSNARCSTRQLAVLVIAAISLTACATATSEPRMATHGYRLSAAC